MAKQIIQIVWTPPPTVENLDASIYKIRTEDGLIKVMHDKDGIVRILPLSQVTLIQFLTQEERPSLILPKPAVPNAPAQ